MSSSAGVVRPANSIGLSRDACGKVHFADLLQSGSGLRGIQLLGYRKCRSTNHRVRLGSDHFQQSPIPSRHKSRRKQSVVDGDRVETAYLMGNLARRSGTTNELGWRKRDAFTSVSRRNPIALPHWASCVLSISSVCGRPITAESGGPVTNYFLELNIRRCKSNLTRARLRALSWPISHRRKCELSTCRGSRSSFAFFPGSASRL